MKYPILCEHDGKREVVEIGIDSINLDTFYTDFSDGRNNRYIYRYDTEKDGKLRIEFVYPFKWLDNYQTLPHNWLSLEYSLGVIGNKVRILRKHINLEPNRYCHFAYIIERDDLDSTYTVISDQYLIREDSSGIFLSWYYNVALNKIDYPKLIRRINRVELSSKY
ncbi:MAG: hypothetical protein R3301_10075 [Saprospiraceae bacterium]|nr:hypothetical protein [Saprospiraceae bacterium]